MVVKKENVNNLGNSSLTNDVVLVENRVFLCININNKLYFRSLQSIVLYNILLQ